MARRQSKPQKDTIGRVMHEYKHGELTRGRGGKVKNPKQAVAIALREAGASKQQSPKKNRRALKKTKAKERRGETGQARAEGRKTASRSTSRRSTTRRRSSTARSRRR